MTDEEFPPPAEEARPRPASQQSNDLPDARREQDTFLSEPALRERGRAVVVQPSPSARDRPETVASQGVSQTVGVSSPAGPIRIALWGAPGSGKTTFLAALMLAVSTGSRAIGQWTMYPVNAASEEFLVRSVHQLVVEQRFPEATPLSVITPISVILKGDLTGSEFAPRRRFWKRGPVIDSFQLDLLDLAGEAFAYDPERQIPSDTADAAIDNIADAQGLVYFFDPVSEFDRRSSAEYMYSPLVRLLGRMKGQASDRFLPQQVSVCMTKFDHPRIFMQIKQLGLLDENFRVSDRNAKRIFDMYCEGRFSSDDERSYASAQFIRNQLQTYFAPDNVRYFVTSSVGLHRQSANFDDLAGFPRIDPDDFANVYSQHGGLMIRGPIEPINVLEPLISIQQRIRRGRNKA